MTLVLRNGRYHLVRRVPRRFEDIETRKQIWIGLHTDSKELAETKAKLAWDKMLESWDARLFGHEGDADRLYEAEKRTAQAHGFTYLSVERVAELPLKDLTERVVAAETKQGVDEDLALSFLGGVDEPSMTINGALELYFEKKARSLKGKSADQIRRWHNPRKKAFKNFVSVNGNIRLAELREHHMADFYDWWDDRLNDENLSSTSAAKDFTHFCGALNFVNRRERLGLNLPLRGWKFEPNPDEKKKRPPFSDDWIRDRMMARGAMDGLNQEARCLVLGMINTGYRPSEAACLGSDQIRLDTNIPHISIEPIGRTLKTSYSTRKIPLTGISLEAFRQCPDGFPRYGDSASLSALVNKYLRNNDLAESPDHTMYSLRHSFEDRMLRAGIDDRIRRDLFGHKLNREVYGKGADLAQGHDLLASIAL